MSAFLSCLAALAETGKKNKKGDGQRRRLEFLTRGAGYAQSLVIN